MLHKIVEEESGEIRACSGAFGGAPYTDAKVNSNRPMKSAQLKIAPKLYENPSNEQSGEEKSEEKQNEKEEEKQRSMNLEGVSKGLIGEEFLEPQRSHSTIP